MSENAKVSRIMAEKGITEHGFVSFSSVLPLLECRAKSRLPNPSNSVIICLFPYHVAEPEQRNISRYAMVEDYHTVVTKRLSEACDALSAAYPDHLFVPFADNSPIREVSAAVSAGLGMLGKNGLLIHPTYGSFVFIGEIVTDLNLDTEKHRAGCIGCGKCISSCPAGAIGEAGVERERCLSHITQKKGSLSAEEEELIRRGKLVWGCDVCQEVCPYNRAIPETPFEEFRENIEPYVTYERIDELVQTRAFGFRGDKVIKRNYEILYGDQE